MKNTGSIFEEVLSAQHEAYLAQGRAKIEQVSPPCKVFGAPGRQRVILLENPFLDFTGSWIERSGRTLHIEAKATSEPRLGINNATGIKPHQLNNLVAWEKAGAAVGVLWYHAGTARLLTLNQILAALADSRGSVRWEKAYALHQTTDLVFWDYLTALAVIYP